MKYIYYFLCFILPLAAMGCSSDDDNNIDKEREEEQTAPVDFETLTFNPNDASEDVREFFNSEFGISSPQYRDFKWNISTSIDNCIMINTTKEFYSYYTGPKQMPSIDFKNKTLVIGVKLLPRPFHGYLSENIINNGNTYNLKINVFRYENRGYLPATCGYAFWGIFPKLRKKEITILDFNIEEYYE